MLCCFRLTLCWLPFFPFFPFQLGDLVISCNPAIVTSRIISRHHKILIGRPRLVTEPVVYFFLCKQSRTELPSASRKELISLVKAASCGFNGTRSHGRLSLTCNHQVALSRTVCALFSLFQLLSGRSDMMRDEVVFGRPLF